MNISDVAATFRMEPAEGKHKNCRLSVGKAGLSIAMLALVIGLSLPLVGQNFTYLGVAKVLATDTAADQAELSEAIEYLFKGIKARDAGTLAHHFGSLDRSVAYYQEDLQATGSPITRFMLGRVLLEMGQRDMAVKEWRQLGLAGTVQIARDYCRQAEDAMNQGNMTKAIDLAEVAIQLHPTLARAYYVQGVALGGTGNEMQALATLQYALGLESDTNTLVMTYIGLGQVYMRLGRTDEAVAALEVAIKALPDYAHAHHVLAVAYADARNYPEAEDAFGRAIVLETTPSNAIMLWAELATLQTEQGHLEAAKYSWAQLLVLQPGNEQAMHALSDPSQRR